MHFFFIFCAIFGVFSRHFDNGGVQLVAYTVVNLYVFVMCLMNWPVKVYHKEYDINDGVGTDMEGHENAGEFDSLRERPSPDNQDRKNGAGIELKDIDGNIRVQEEEKEENYKDCTDDQLVHDQKKYVKGQSI